ncbi:hypothetical protein Trydic_g17028 [Trypoxylus dichotomus]
MTKNKTPVNAMPSSAIPNKTNLEKAKQILSTREIMATVFWDRRCVLLIDYMPEGEAIDAAAYCQTLSPRYSKQAARNDKQTLILTSIGVIVVKTVCMAAGLVIFAKYSDCDPFETKIIKNLDELLPMYVMDTTSFIPGFAGLFLSGIFGAALSALSASLNCLAATVYQDFISPFVSKGTSQERISLYLKLLVIVIGVFTTACVFIVEKLGGLLALTLSIAGITGGPLLGLFSVGMLAPVVNSKGALYGSIVSLIVNSWLILGGLWYKMKGFTYPTLPISTDGCNKTISNQFNETFIQILNTNVNVSIPEQDQPFILYRISFYCYFTKDDKPLNRNCISPVAHFLLKKEDEPPKYETIERAIKIVNGP